jgi:hypothetical protein
VLEAGCAPPLEDDEEYKEYKYMIEVHNTASGVKNTLDPLVRVEE